MGIQQDDSFSAAEPPPISPQLQSLLHEFISLTGQPDDASADAVALEFTSGEYKIDVYPPGKDPTLFVLEVQALTFDTTQLVSDFTRLRWLHHRNDLVRREDGWIATISSENTLVFSRRMRVQDTTPGELSEAMADGVECAENFAEAWKSQDFEANPTSEDERSEPARTVMMIC